MAEDLYELIRERYERKALILTSNRALVEWPAAFANNLLCERCPRSTHASLPRPGNPRRRATASAAVERRTERQI